MADIPLALYMWTRIHQLGIDGIMGVPGDFNLQFLDFIYQVPGLSYAIVGNANELNAAYAADGYSRVRGTPGCLVTTHGVGELSAINGIAGAMSEHSPVIHVVGQTPRKIQENHVMMHHSIGTKPDHQIYNKTSQHLRCAAAELWDPQNAPAEIDRVLRECVIQSLPVYIFFPLDLTHELVPASALDTPLDLTLPVNSANETSALEAIISKLKSAQNPCIFYDLLAVRHAKKEARKLAYEAKLPVYTSHMGRGIVDETDCPYFIGLWNGSASYPGVSEAATAADVMLSVGWYEVDTNSSGFTRNYPQAKRIDIMDTYVVIDGNIINDVYMAPLLSKLTSALGELNLPNSSMPKLPPIPDFSNASQASTLTHKYIWPRLTSFFRTGDVVITDTGTATFGVADSLLPKNATYINQTYYGSIGYATPAAFGVDVALREIHSSDDSQSRRRTVLITGDGSLQLTIQEIGSMVTHGLEPFIIILNNNGYTIERAIHGCRFSYNDINTHDYSYLLHLFRAPDAEKCFRLAKTPAEFDAALEELSTAEGKGRVKILEVLMHELDLPWRLKGVLESKEDMRKYLKEEGFESMG